MSNASLSLSYSKALETCGMFAAGHVGVVMASLLRKSMNSWW